MKYIFYNNRIIIQDFGLGIVTEEKYLMVYFIIQPNENICTDNKEFTYCFMKSNPSQLVFVKLDEY